MTPVGTSDQGVLVTEVFSAIQGEGALVGHRQVFLRLTGCHLRCSYCDQPEALEKRPGPCLVEQTAGRRDFITVASPLRPDAVVDAVARLWDALPHHSVSVTGGEPLMQAGALGPVLAGLASRGMRLFLETSGTLPDRLALVVEHLDVVSMDIKLNSVDGQGVDIDVHRKTLTVARGANRLVYAKVVLGPATDRSEFRRAVAMIACEAPDIEIYLQPVTPCGAVTAAPTAEEVLELHELALHLHPHVRVVPQTHKAIGQR